MGAKTCLIVQTEGDARGILAAIPTPDEACTSDFVASLFPDCRFAAPVDADLSCTYVRDGCVVAGCFPGLRIVVSSAVAVDRPSRLPTEFIARRGTTFLHAMHSVVDWFAFAVWENGVLVRSLSVAPDSGVIEDLGDRLAFEMPYWAGAHPAADPDDEPDDEPDDDPLPFHPLELGEAALREFLGFQIEGIVDASLLEPERVRMFRFETPAAAQRRSTARRPWWKFW